MAYYRTSSKKRDVAPRVFNVKNLPHVLTDGGRKEAGYKGSTGDCVIRAIAVATGEKYKDIYKAIFAMAKANPTFRQAMYPHRCSPRFGVYQEHYQEYLEARGWKWIPATELQPESGKITEENIKMVGTAIIKVHRHLMAVKDGVVHDSFPPSQLRDGWVLGAFVKIERAYDLNNRT